MLEASERSRLEKLLGMLGSSFDGERANAARMIAAMAEKHRTTIVGLIFGPVASEQPRRARAEPQREERPRRQGRQILDGLVDAATHADELEFTLTEWELQFARDVSDRYGQDYELSEKQIVIAERILRKVEIARERSKAGA